MADEPRGKATSESDDFAAQAKESAPNIFVEFLDFLRENKKWWLAPILIVVLLLVVLVVLVGSTAAPLIYPLI